MPTSDLVIGAVGAMAILLAFTGLTTIDARAGPYESDLEPVVLGGEIRGTYHYTASSGTMLPGGTCMPTVPASDCAPPHLRVSLRATGLPDLGPSLHYAVFILGDGTTFPLGVLDNDGDTHTFTFDGEVGSAHHVWLVISIETSVDAAAPSAARVLHHTLGDRTGYDEIPIEAPLAPALPDAAGALKLTQIGAVTVSARTAAELSGLAAMPGVSYRAWIGGTDGTADFIHLGDFETDPDDATRASLSSRVERLQLADHERFLVTLGPADLEPRFAQELPVLLARL